MCGWVAVRVWADGCGKSVCGHLSSSRNSHGRGLHHQALLEAPVEGKLSVLLCLCLYTYIYIYISVCVCLVSLCLCGVRGDAGGSAEHARVGPAGGCKLKTTVPHKGVDNKDMLLSTIPLKSIGLWFGTNNPAAARATVSPALLLLLYRCI